MWRPPAADDPALTVVAWEAVEELLAVVPEGPSKTACRLLAAGCPLEEIAVRMGCDVDSAAAHVARARVRVLTAAIAGDDGAPG